MTFDNLELILSGTPANDDVGEHLITVTAVDTHLASVSISFIITVINVNDAPLVWGVPSVEMWEGLPGYVILRDTFYDVDVGDSLTYSWVGPDCLVVVFNEAELTFELYHNGIGFGEYFATITATDTFGASVSYTISIKFLD